MTETQQIFSIDETPAGRQLAIDLSSRQTLVGVLGAIALLFVLAALRSTTGTTIPILTPVLAVLFLTFVPGFLVYRLAALQASNHVDRALYIVGLSLVALMGLGLLVDYGLFTIGITEPVRPIPFVGGIGVLLGVLATITHRYADAGIQLTIPTCAVWHPVVLGSLLLPVAGIYGALALTHLDTNLLLLALYAALAATPVLVIMNVIPDRHVPLLIWAVGAALVFQNTLTGNYLAWGDQPKEAALVLQVLQDGVWRPVLAESFASKYAMLRITMLHPIYMLFAGLGLLVEFKVVHPLLWSATPVVLYQAFRKQLATKTAYLAAFYYVSLFSFFIVLSRNTRTAMAIFFLALIGLLAANREMALRDRKLLAIPFVLGIVVSHYGVSYMVLLMLVGAWLILKCLDYLVGDGDASLLSPTYVGVYLTGLFGWYIYATASGKPFNMFVGFSQSFVERIQEDFLSPSASASTKLATQQWTSGTLEFLTDLNLAFGLIMGIGLLVTGYRVLRDRELEGFTTEYFALAITAMAVFSITFLPVERFNTARTYATTLIFFVPFFAIGLTALATRLTAHTLDRQPQDRSVHTVIVALVLVYFLLNVGFVSAMFTHEYSPNALVEKERIMYEGEPPEATYFYKQYPTTYGVEAGAWLRTHGVANTDVYVSGWPGGLGGAIGHESYRERTADAVPLTQQQITADTTMNGTSYVYLGPYSVYTNVVRYPSGHFQFEYAHTDQISHKWQHKDRIYDGGGAVIYH